MKPIFLDPDMPVDEIMRRWPAAIRVMIRHGMLCVGCPIGIFHTVTDACIAHGIDEALFSAELLAAMRGDADADMPSAFEDRAAKAAEERGACGGAVTSGAGSPPPA